MSHKRTVIRNALATLLSGQTGAGTNVFKNRIHNIPRESLSALVIRDSSETSEERSLGPRFVTRKWTIKIDILVEVATDHDIALDDIAKEIEDLLIANRTISATCMNALYTGMEEPQVTEAAKPVSILTLNYEITYSV